MVIFKYLAIWPHHYRAFWRQHDIVYGSGAEVNNIRSHTIRVESSIYNTVIIRNITTP